ncbi:MAG: CPBP family intramembrane metalloprotease [Gemmatimonadota bacterium]|nr:MAG: CPBP family intramembrane metalloprotease [Gemmatimonadota bacterium]
MKERKVSEPVSLFSVYAAWIVVGELAPYLNRLVGLGRYHTWLLAAIRMTLLVLVTFAYIRAIEKRPFCSGFNLSFQQIPKNILWAVVFFLVAGLILMPYQFFVVRPLTEGFVTASAGISHEAARPFADRLVEYLYIVYEGIVEALIFIGFLLDRLARRWGWLAAILVSNLAFALWHYDYLASGLLTGSLMMILTFLAGVPESLSYVKTKNSLSPIICHTLIDSPMSIRILLGMV